VEFHQRLLKLLLDFSQKPLLAKAEGGFLFVLKSGFIFIHTF